MNSTKKTIFFLLIIALVILMPKLSISQDPATIYCVLPQPINNNYCIEISSEFTQDMCINQYQGNAPIIVGESQKDEACQIGCCCDLNDNQKYPKAYCESLSGTFKEVGICDLICSSSNEERFNLTANINSIGQTSNQYYTLFYLQDIVKDEEFQGNTLSIQNLLPRSYDLKIDTDVRYNNKDYECSKTEQITIQNQNVISNIELDLSHCEEKEIQDQQPNPDGCVSLWIYEFEHEMLNCGEVLNVSDLNECILPTRSPIYEVGDEVVCIDLSPGQCGNNELNIGEQCEIINENVVYAQGYNSCQDLGFETGELRCSSCLVDKTFCSNCPTISDACDSTMCDCEICQQTNICEAINSCQPQDTLNLDLTRLFEEESGFKLEWDAPDLCLEDASINIYKKRCGLTQDSCEPNFGTDKITPESLPANSSPYLDVINILDTRTYCYRIQLKTNTIPGITLNSSIECDTLPDSACLGKIDGEKFCHNNQIVQCEDGKNNTIKPCSADEQCINPSTQEPMCISSDICDACSGPFGVFGFMMFDSDFEIKGYSCEDAETEFICFREDYAKSLSAFGMFNECAEVNSCYDYKTKGSCERNTCDKDGGVDACEWQDFQGGELGLGTCRPENVELQDCNMCDKNALGGYCSEEMCALYGDCYYNENPKEEFAVDMYYCNNKDEVGCETYNTLNECEGNFELDIDIGYNNLFESVSGTHQIINPSDDSLNKGICVWLEPEQKCIRDADFTTSISNLLKSSDCNRNKKDIFCLTDFTKPITNVTIKGKSIEDEGTYSTRQFYTVLQVLRSEQASTYYSIIKESELSGLEFLYPNLTFNAFAHYIEEIEEEQEDGEYVFAYYSKDKANNLEEVQYKKINLLSNLKLNINHDLNSKFYPEIGEILSNITITITSPSQDHFTCQGILMNLEGPIGPRITKSTTTNTINYPYALLQDGPYIFNLTCYDEYNQLTKINYEFEILEDNILSNPLPSMETFNQNQVTISIESESKATCTYEDIVNKNNNIEGTFNSNELANGRFNHTKTITTDVEGVYIIKPSCIFDDTSIGNNGEYFGNPGDYITFGIDKTAPRIKIYDKKLSSPNNKIEYNRSLLPEYELDLEFVCDDSYQLLNYNGFDFSYGCKNTTYKLNYTYPLIDETVIIESGILKSGDSKKFIAPEQYAIINLNLNVSDIGGNYELHEIRLRLRKLDYDVPIIDICDPETQMCI